MNPANILGLTAAYLASFAAFLLVVRRRGLDEIGRLILRDRFVALITLGPVIILASVSVGAASNIHNVIHGGPTIADVEGSVVYLALFALIVPWARFTLVDVPMSEAWWTGSKHLVACVAIFLFDGCFQAVIGEPVNAFTSFLVAVLWTLWRYRGNGGGWDFDNAPQPDPVTGTGIRH